MATKSSVKNTGAKRTTSKPTRRARAVPARPKPSLPVTGEARNIPEDFVSETFSGQDSLAALREKAQHVYAKGTEALGELRQFAAGNIEAVKESGSALGSGLQDLSNSSLADGKAAIEVIKADVRQLTSLRTPADLFQFQTALLRRNFDAARALTSRNGQALQKLAQETVAPLSRRAGEVAGKIRKPA